MTIQRSRGGWLTAIMGLGLIPTGLLVAHRPGIFGRGTWRILTPPLLNQDGLAIFIGVALVVLGALLVAFAGRTRSARMTTGLPSPRSLWDAPAVASFFVGLALSFMLWANLAASRYPLWNGLLFVLSLSLMGFAVHRLDRPRRWRSPLARLDLSIASACGAASAAINGIGLVRWQFSWIGDEGAFFVAARGVFGARPFNLFDLTVVYDSHPMLDTFYQAMAMRLFGADAWGWRFGEVLVVAALSAMIYLLGTLLFDRLVGAVAAVVVGMSHYLMAFTRIGYNNLHALFWSTLAILLIALAWRTRRAVFTWCAGCAVGLCAYTFSPALFVGPTLAALLGIPFLLKPTRRQAAAGTLLVMACIIVVVPGLISTPLSELIENAQQQTRREFSASDPGTTFLYSLVRSSVSLLVNREWHNHYVASALLDPISAALFTIGLATTLLGVRRRAERTVLLWFVLGLLMLAVTNYLPVPQVTRLLYLMPPIALLAGLGGRITYRTMAGTLRWPKWTACAALTVAVVSIPPINAYLLHARGPRLIPTKPEAMAVKALFEQPDSTFLFVGDERNENLELLLQRYPQLAGHAVVAALDELGVPPPQCGPLLQTPLIWTSQPQLVLPLQRALGATHRLKLDYGSNGDIGAWIFQPTDSKGSETRAGCLGDVSLELELEVGKKGRDGPWDVATDSEGKIYVAVKGENRIHVFAPNGRHLGSWGETGADPPSFIELSAVEVASDGSVWALDHMTSQIHAFDNRGRPLSRVISHVGYRPRGLGLAPNGDLVVAITGKSEVRRYDLDGHLAASLAKREGVAFELGEPTGVAVTADAQWLILDALRYRVLRLEPDGRPITSWPIPKPESAATAGNLVLHPSGHILVTRPTSLEVGDVGIYDLSGRLCCLWTIPELSAPVGIHLADYERILLTFPKSGIVRVYRFGSIGSH